MKKIEKECIWTYVGKKIDTEASLNLSRDSRGILTILPKNS